MVCISGKHSNPSHVERTASERICFWFNETIVFPILDRCCPRGWIWRRPKIETTCSWKKLLHRIVDVLQDIPSVFHKMLECWVLYFNFCRKSHSYDSFMCNEGFWMLWVAQLTCLVWEGGGPPMPLILRMHQSSGVISRLEVQIGLIAICTFLHISYLVCLFIFHSMGHKNTQCIWDAPRHIPRDWPPAPLRTWWTGVATTTRCTVVATPVV